MFDLPCPMNSVNVDSLSVTGHYDTTTSPVRQMTNMFPSALALSPGTSPMSAGPASSFQVQLSPSAHSAMVGCDDMEPIQSTSPLNFSVSDRKKSDPKTSPVLSIFCLFFSFFFNCELTRSFVRFSSPRCHLIRQICLEDRSKPGGQK